MGKNVNFANREVADLILLDYASQKPFLNVDWANVTSTSFEAERVFAKGGQGAPNRVQFDGSRTGTLTIEAQVYPVKVFQMLSGNELAKVANVLKREKIKATADGLEVSATPEGSTAQVYKADDDCGTEITGTVNDKKITGAGITDGEDYVVYYFTKIENAQVVKFDTKHFPKAFHIEGSTPFKTEDDEIIESRHIWYKAAPQGSFELSWQNEGDPASITLNFDIMADDNDQVYDMVFPNAADAE